MTDNMFKPGDRVVVIAENQYFTSIPVAPKGSIGTVLDSSIAPWVLFDKHIGTDYKFDSMRTDLPMKSSYTGRIDCFAQHKLALHESKWASFKRRLRKLLFQFGTEGERNGSLG